MKKSLFLLISIIYLIFITGCFKKEETKKFYGNVDLRTVSLGFRVSGKIDKLSFDEGQKVKKNDVLAKLKDDLYLEHLNSIKAQIKMQKMQIKKLESGYRKETITSAKATYDKSIVAFKKAKKDFIRYKALNKTKSVSKQIFDDYKFAYEEAKAQINLTKSQLEKLKNGYRKEDIFSAKATLEQLKAQKNLSLINLNDTKLLAPNDGIVLTRIHEIGAIVDKGSPVFDLALTNEYWVRSYIDEKYLGLIQPQMKAKVYTDSKPDKYYSAKVSFISAQAEFTPKNVQTQELRTQLVYRIRLILENPDKYIRQGMPVTIEFENLN